MSARICNYIFIFVLVSCFSFASLAADLSDLAYRLAKQAEDFATDSYRGFNNRNRGNQNNDVAMLFSIQQFSSGSNLLRRMVDDRRPVSELNSACELLKQQSGIFSSYAFGRQRAGEIQRLLDEISAELNISSTNNSSQAPSRESVPTPQRDIPTSSTVQQNVQQEPRRIDSRYSTIKAGPGWIKWEGVVDNEVQVQISGSRVYAQVISGQDVRNMKFEFEGSLPEREVTVSVKKGKGRGTVQILEQPSRMNGYQAVVRIQDPKGGSDEYQFQLSW